MKKSFLQISFLLFAFTNNVYSFEKTCEDFGAVTVQSQIAIRSSGKEIRVGEPQDFCVLKKNERISEIGASSLLSHNPNMAATAYRTAPKPVMDGIGERGDYTFCRMLGGAYRMGNIVSGGWIDISNPSSAQSGMCVFTDGSMISTWTLFYKRQNPTGAERPDFEPYFQNESINSLWLDKK